MINKNAIILKKPLTYLFEFVIVLLILAILCVPKKNLVTATQETNNRLFNLEQEINNRLSSLEQKMISRTRIIKQLGSEHNFDIMFIAE